MGKDSLIKSTAGKSASKKKKATAKKAASPKSTSAKSKKNVTPANNPKNPTPTKPNSKVTMKDLLFKQFGSQKPPSSEAAPPPDPSRWTAPPLIDSDNPETVERLRALLFKQYSMADIKAAAKAPIEIKKQAAPEPAPEKTPAPQEASETAEPAVSTTPPETEMAPAASTASVESTEKPVEAISETQIAPSVSSVPPEPIAPPPAAAISETEPEQKPEPTAPPATETESEPLQAASIETSTAQMTPPVEPSGQTVPISDAPEPEEVPPTRSQDSSNLPPGSNGGSEDPVMRSMKFGAVAIGLIAVLIIWASFTNSTRYYIEPERDGVSILRGSFSPTGTRTIAVLPRMKITEPIQDVYSRQDVYPLIFAYYIANADHMLEARGLPDFPTIEAHLQQADRFALNREMSATVNSRRENLQRIQLIHQAHVEISKGTPESMDAALRNLNQAKRLTTDTVQMEAINQIETLVNERKAQATQVDQAPVEKQER